MTQAIEDADEHFSEELTSRFLKSQTRDLGYDLPSLIVQMGRDHGKRDFDSYLGNICEIEATQPTDCVRDQTVDVVYKMSNWTFGVASLWA